MSIIGVIFFVLFLAGLIYLALNRAKIKGIIGEKILSSLLMFLDKEVYHIYNDLYIETSRGTSQIDHIVVLQYGISGNNQLKIKQLYLDVPNIFLNFIVATKITK